MSTDREYSELRIELSAELHMDPDCYEMECLLPVVDRIATARAAAELRAAAQWLTGTGNAGDSLAPDRTSDGLSWRLEVRTPNQASDWFEQSLRDRADALDGAHPCSGRFCRTCADAALAQQVDDGPRDIWLRS